MDFLSDSVEAIARRVRRGEQSAREVVEHAIHRIETIDPVVNAFVAWDGERALAQAGAVDAAVAAGRDPGPLAGVPVGVKDLEAVQGHVTSFGSALHVDDPPAEHDSVHVARLRAAGAIIMGKTNTPEFATGGNTFNEVFGATRNPWDPALSAGGSTGGGAAALASGMIALAEGTDLGGSLRIPASFCGVVGLRPTAGLVPTWPSEYPWDDLQVTGFLARTAEDVALALSATAGPDPRAPIGVAAKGRDFVGAALAGDAGGLRIAYCPDVAGIGVDPEVEAVCRRAAFELGQAGAEVSEVALDLAWAWEPYQALRGHWMVTQQRTRLHQLGRMGDNLAGNVRAGLAVGAEELAAAEQARGRVWDVFFDFFRRFDHLLTPCMAVPPFPVEQNYPPAIGGREMRTYVDWIAPTFLLSLTGLPVAAVPCGLDGDGLPVGLQAVGRPRDEEAVLGLAAAIQRAYPIGRPPLLGGRGSGPRNRR